MQITDSNQLLDLGENEFVGELPEMTNSQINFTGKNNILICEEGVHLWNSRIDFNLDNSVLYLSESCYDYSVNIALHKNNTCFIGKNNFFNGRTTFVLSEAKNIILGDNCFISSMWFSEPQMVTASTMLIKKTDSTMQEAYMSVTMSGSARMQWFSRDQK